MRQISFTALSAGLLIAGSAPAFAGEAPGFITLERPISAPRGYIEMCDKSTGPLCETGQASESLQPAAETSADASPIADGATGAVTHLAKRVADVACPAIRLDKVAFVPELPSLAFETRVRVGSGSATLYPLTFDLLTPAGQVLQPSAERQPVSRCSADQSAVRPFADLSGWRPRRILGESAVEAVSFAANVATPAVVPPASVASEVSPASLKMLREVNTSVNRRVMQRTDQQMFGRGEVWRRTGTGRGAQGDCEDLAIEKRLELLAKGFPADRLFFGVVYRGDIGLHTILVARADDGDYVMDSMTSGIVGWADAPYSWISVQAPGRPSQWYSVGSKRKALPGNGVIAAQNPSESGTSNLPT